MRFLFHNNYLPFLLLFILAACEKDQVGSASESTSDSRADIAFTNAYVYTVDSGRNIEEAVAIKGNRIVYVGDDAGLAEFVGTDTEVYDLGGRMLMPGIHDTHIHGSGIADLDICDMQSKAFTLEEMVPFLKDCIERYEVEKGEWLVVSQWAFSYGNQPSERLPTLRAALDAVSTEHPIMLAGNDGHHGAVNSLALAAAKDDSGKVVGINRETLNTVFKTYVDLVAVDESGEPSGGISEYARFLVKDDYGKEYIYLFKPPEVMMPLVAEKLAANGITSILDAYVDPYLLEYYEWLAENDGMSFRLLAALYGDIKNSLSPEAYRQVPQLVEQLVGMRERLGRFPNVEANAVKLLVDGVLEGNPYANPPTLPVAAVLQPFKQPVFSFNEETGAAELKAYVDANDSVCQNIPCSDKPRGFDQQFTTEHGFHPSQCIHSSGVLEHDQRFIQEFIRQATENSFHVHIHALSDKAVRITLDAFEAVKDVADKLDVPQSITHVQLVHPDDVLRIGELGVYVAATYAWADPDLEYDMSVIPFVDEIRDPTDLYNLDGYYMKNTYPFRSIMKAGGILTWGSDAPVESRDPRPFENLQIAVTRAAQGRVLNENETISIHDALAAFTINGARMMKQEDRVGSIEKGKIADLIVLDQNVVQLAEQGDAESIMHTRVDLTMFDGNIIYQRQ